ncbi:MAG: hypothetical protein WB685_17850, partial [Pseudolabrys sp.]
MRFTVLGAIVLSTLFVPARCARTTCPTILIPGAPTTTATRVTLDQCRATVSGIGGFCEHNQFYNPRSGQRRTA